MNIIINLLLFLLPILSSLLIAQISNPLFLLGLGLDELSVNPQSIPGVKQAIARFSIVESEAIVASALQQDSAVHVRKLISTSVIHPTN
ncbi:hypothetical protein [Nostoc commune]|uniref:hypothetical protein n=1 Tax=Nostoc commune TaxID=1178 RepID=UPI0018C656A7